eukprot:GHVN01017534.1.p1 GENE.GHVN01017534.1~~GHVN01017534.1.p1  ORF type:complete len:202 (-),score=26.59 GHVN01017534.1:116-721(-)
MIKNTKNVLLFAPNIIGYIRVLLLLCAVWVSERVWVFTSLYLVSELLDMADGAVARHFNQCSKFGAVLDQVTDRLSTCVVMMLLCGVYPHRCFWFILALLIDLGGHWFHTISSATAGAYHKDIPEEYRVLKAYYQIKGLMAMSIVAYEGFWLSLLVNQAGKYSWLTFLTWTFFPLAFFKAVTNILQLMLAAEVLVKCDTKK